MNALNLNNEPLFTKLHLANISPSLVLKMQEFCIVALAKACCLLGNAEYGIIIGSRSTYLHFGYEVLPSDSASKSQNDVLL
jgi:hypothetical protein